MEALKEKQIAQRERLLAYLERGKAEYCIHKERGIPTRYKRHGWFYLYESNGFLKAGMTRQPSTVVRRKQHERDYGERMKLVARRFCMNVALVEREFHRLFYRYRDHSVVKAYGEGTRECYFPEAKAKIVEFIKSTSFKTETDFGRMLKHF